MPTQSSVKLFIRQVLFSLPNNKDEILVKKTLKSIYLHYYYAHKSSHDSSISRNPV